MPPDTELTVNVLVLDVVVGFGKLNVIDVAEPPVATDAVAAVEPVLVQFQTALCEQVIVTVEGVLGPPLLLLNATGEPEDVPPDGDHDGPFDFPQRLLIEIAPDAIPANVLTALSPSDVVAVDARPSSTLT
jgi:hypothetical protein